MADKRDYALGLRMLRVLKVRDNYYENRDVYCSCNFHIGQPVLQSVWANELIIPDENAKSEKREGRVVSRRRKLGKK